MTTKVKPFTAADVEGKGTAARSLPKLIGEFFPEKMDLHIPLTALPKSKEVADAFEKLDKDDKYTKLLEDLQAS